MGQRPLTMRDVKEQRPRWRLTSNAEMQHITRVSRVLPGNTRDCIFWAKTETFRLVITRTLSAHQRPSFCLFNFRLFIKLHLTDFGWSAQSISSLTGSFSRETATPSRSLITPSSTG